MYETVEFRTTVLCGASFRHATLKSVYFSSATFDYQTRFDGAIIDKVHVDRFNLQCLGDDRGGLTDGQLRKMSIHDDVALLRGQFGGFYGVVYLISLIGFLSPYFWFVAMHWPVTSSTESNSISLLNALFNFVVSGGDTWRETAYDGWAIFRFTAYALYNLARGLLLYKTNLLETLQKVTGLPAEFSLRKAPYWKLIYRTTRYGYWFSFLLAAWNLLAFFMRRIPL
jgi:hypothetical protein